MTRLIILTNFRSGRNKTRPEVIRELSRAAGGECREVDELGSFRRVTAQVMNDGVDILGINGGDGTVHAVLTELMGLGCELPELAIIPGGTTNMTANDLNDKAALEVTLHRLAEETAVSRNERRVVHRPMLRAEAEGISPQYGFCLSAGATLDGMEHFKEKVGSRGLRGELAAGISVLRGLAGLMRGESAWTRRRDTTVSVAGAELHDQILVISTTLERMLLDFTPWWGKGTGPIHLTALRRKPEAIVRRAPAFLRGRGHPGFTLQNGYYSENVPRFELKPDSGFALDGEIFDPGPDVSVHVSATDPIRFLRLNGR